MANLLRDLSTAWRTEGDSPPARAALQRWATERPDFAHFASPAHLVTAGECRSDALAHRLLDELTELAPGDRWAARTVLQTILPGLARLARQHDNLVGDGVEPFATLGELDQFLLCTAFERIPYVAAEAPAFRLRTLLDSTWTRLRSHAEAHRRECSNRVPLADHHEPQAPPARTDAEELALALIDAVQRGVLRRLDAGLVYATRVVGHSPAELAEVLDWRTGSVVRRRQRVARVLAAEVLGQPRPDQLAPAAG